MPTDDDTTAAPGTDIDPVGHPGRPPVAPPAPGADHRSDPGADPPVDPPAVTPQGAGSDPAVGEADANGDADADDATVLSRRNLTLLVGPIIALVVASNLGNAFFVQLSLEKPLLLITLNAANRNLILVSGQVAFLPYFLVGTLRLLAPDVFFYLLGYFYSDRAIVWMERRTPRFGTMMRQLEEVFGRYGHALVLIFPNNPVCLLAGAARMRPRVFWTLNIAGTIGRVLLMLWFGVVFQDAVDWALEFIGTYRLPLTVISIGLVAFTVLRELKAGTSEIQQLLELEDELEPEPDDTPEPRA